MKVPIRVAVQHQRRLLRDVLAAYLDEQPGFAVVGRTAADSELARLCDLRQPDVALIEIDTERWDALELIGRLRARHKGLRVIGMYDSLRPDRVVRAYQAGASRLVTYSGGISAVLAAIHAPDPLLPREDTTRGRQLTETLTERELEVLCLVSSGATLNDAAKALGVSPHTLENHKRRIFAKLGVHSQAHATAAAARLGLLGPPALGRPQMPVTPPGGGRPRVLALVRGRPGPVVDQVRRLVVENGIPMLVQEDRSAPELPQDEGPVMLVAVLVAPEADDWHVAEVLDAQVVVVSTGPLEQRHIADALLRGAAAVMPVDQIAEHLPAAFRLVSEGYMLVETEGARAFIRAMCGRTAETWSLSPLELTNREQEILLSIDLGHSVKQTARLLGISVRTVENLQSRLFRKLGVRNRAEALSVAYGLGLVAPEHAPA